MKTRKTGTAHKAVLSILTAVSLLLASSLSACGKTETSGSDVTTEASTAAVTTEESTAADSTEETTTETSAPTETTASTVTSDETTSLSTETETSSSATTTTTTTTTAAPKPSTTTTKRVTTTTTTQKPVTFTTTTVTTTKPIQTGEVSSSEIYKQNIVIAGDSIATGFSLFGFVPSAHSISLGSLSMSNMDWYYPQQKGVYFVDAVANIQPKLLYISMGMNDVNVTTPEGYAQKYTNVINQIRQRVPDATIVAAAITPVYDGIRFTNNARIRSFNTALANAVAAIGSDHVYYFDAYSVLADPNTLGLRSGYSSGDGIHLATSCYPMMLNSLYAMLDTTPTLKNMGY